MDLLPSAPASGNVRAMGRARHLPFVAWALAACTRVTGLPEPDGALDASDADVPRVDARPPSPDRLLPRDLPCGPGAVRPGTPDPSLRRRLALFPGDAGVRAEFAPTQVLQDGAGRYLVAGYGPGCLPSRTEKDGWVLRYGEDGALDPTWGLGGRLCFDGTQPPTNRNQAFLGMALDPEGRGIVVGFDLAPGVLQPVVARLTERGALDDDFGAGGVTHLSPMPSRSAQWAGVGYDLALDRDRLVIAGTDNFLDSSHTIAFVYGVSHDGSPDPRFAAGRAAFGRLGSAFTAVTAAREGYVAVGSSRIGEHLYVARFTEEGALDPAFGDRGEALFPPLGEVGGRAVIEVPEGYLVAGATGEGAQRALVARITRAGALDPAFGVAGVARLDLLWNYTYQLRGALARACDGRILVAGRTALGPRVVALRADGALDTGFGVDGALDVPADVASAQIALVTLALDPRGGRATLLVNDFGNRGPALYRFSL